MGKYEIYTTLNYGNDVIMQEAFYLELTLSHRHVFWPEKCKHVSTTDGQRVQITL